MIHTTTNEFEKLKIGDFVRTKAGQLYVVKDDYVWGPPCKVCQVTTVESDNSENSINNKSGSQCQISCDNYMYWKVVNK